MAEDQVLSAPKNPLPPGGGRKGGGAYKSTCACSGDRPSSGHITQARIKPPTFVAFSNDASGLPANYHRYLENALRKQFGFAGTPIKIIVRTRRGKS